jgi:hypothetical protein
MIEHLSVVVICFQGPTEAERKIEELTRQLEEEMEKQEEEGEYFGKLLSLNFPYYNCKCCAPHTLVECFSSILSYIPVREKHSILKTSMERSILVECMYFSEEFFAVLYTSLVFVVCHCRYKSTVARLTTLHTSHCTESEVFSSYYVLYSP